MNTIFFNPNRIVVKAIALTACLCFLWQDIAWAAGGDFLRQRQMYIKGDASARGDAAGLPILSDKDLGRYAKQDAYILSTANGRRFKIDGYYFRRAEAITRKAFEKHGLESIFNQYKKRRERAIKIFAFWLSRGYITEKMLLAYIEKDLPKTDAQVYRKLLRKKPTRKQAMRMNRTKGSVLKAVRFIQKEYGISLNFDWQTFIERHVKIITNDEMQDAFGYKSGGWCDIIFDVIFLSEDLREAEIASFLIHEWLHLISVGFSSRYLDEALTDFLTHQILGAQSQGLLKVYKRVTFKNRKSVVKRVARLITNLPAEQIRYLVEAYFSGDIAKCPFIPWQQARFMLHGNTNVRYNGEIIRFSEALREMKERAGITEGETVLVKFSHSPEDNVITISRTVANANGRDMSEEDTDKNSLSVPVKTAGTAALPDIGSGEGRLPELTALVIDKDADGINQIKGFLMNEFGLLDRNITTEMIDENLTEEQLTKQRKRPFDFVIYRLPEGGCLFMNETAGDIKIDILSIEDENLLNYAVLVCV